MTARRRRSPSNRRRPRPQNRRLALVVDDRPRLVHWVVGLVIVALYAVLCISL